jgi:hypothetical protein
MTQSTLFVQFADSSYRGKVGTLVLCNGFQHVHEQCKQRGDFFWARFCSSEEAMHANQLPISHGTVYVSAWYYDHLLQSYIWALNYPNIQFIVGGPAPRYGGFTNEQLPKNLYITKKLFEEELLNQQNPSKSWDLELPAELAASADEIQFSYNIDRRCYWGKCTFCEGYTKPWEKTLNNDVDKLKIPQSQASKVVRLNIPSVTPKFLKNSLPKLPRRDDVMYDFFIRASDEIVPVAAKVLEDCKNGLGPKPENFRWIIGVEWPSNRMLDYMRKGESKERIMELIDITSHYGVNIGVPFIVGWNNLTQNDVDEAKDFVTRIENCSSIKSAVVFTLEVHPSTPLYGLIDKKDLVPVHRKVFNNGECRVHLSDEQAELNEEFRQFFLQSKLNSFMYDGAVSTTDAHGETTLNPQYDLDNIGIC